MDIGIYNTSTENVMCYLYKIASVIVRRKFIRQNFNQRMLFFRLTFRGCKKILWLPPTYVCISSYLFSSDRNLCGEETGNISRLNMIFCNTDIYVHIHMFHLIESFCIQWPTKVYVWPLFQRIEHFETKMIKSNDTFLFQMYFQQYNTKKTKFIINLKKILDVGPPWASITACYHRGMKATKLSYYGDVMFCRSP